MRIKENCKNEVTVHRLEMLDPDALEMRKSRERNPGKVINEIFPKNLRRLTHRKRYVSN
jgi:hypothetical protein